ncbi:MAG: DUF1849 family protein [Reyranellaceae bacterium]
MLNARSTIAAVLVALAVQAAPSSAQEIAPHRAAYSVVALERGKPTGGTPGTYAYELRLTCEGYVINQRLRLEISGAHGAVANEQQSQMTESRDGKRLRFEHRTSTGNRQSTVFKGEATLGDDGSGEARFTEPTGQTVALPARTMFPVAISRETIRQAKAGETGFDALFFFGDKAKPPQSVNVIIGKVPKRLSDVKVPDGAESLVDGRGRIYYRAGFFDEPAKGQGQGEPAFEVSSVMLDNGIELYGTHEQGDGGIEYRITRLEPLPKPDCK